MRVRLNSFPTLVLVMIACGGSGAKPGESPGPAAADVVPCTVTPPESADSWREVKGKGFTFCVPAKWTSAGSTEVRDPQEGTIKWGDAAQNARVPFAVGRVSATGPFLPSGPPSSQLPQADQFAEVVAGRVVKFSVMKLSNEVVTTATWADPISLALVGQARATSDGQLHLAIFRTVRFPSP